MITGILLKIKQVALKARYYEVLAKYVRDHPCAYDVCASECLRCGRCCLQRPCDLTPDDIEKMAKHLGITKQEFFAQYCVVDSMLPGMDTNSFNIVLRRHSQKPAKFLSWERTYDIDTPCVFYENNGCKIHDCKPRTGVFGKCWGELDTDPHDLVHKWTEQEIRDLGYTGRFYDDDEGETAGSAGT